MKNTYLRVLGVTAALSTVLLFSAGCRDYVGKEKTHPLYIKAGASRVAGNYTESAQYFEEFLNVCPKSPLAHYEAASLYAENLDEPFKALYHYEKYLELDPETLDAGDVRQIMQAQKKKIFDVLSTEFESSNTEKLKAEYDKTRTLLSQYAAQYKILKEQNDTMRKMLTDRKITVPSAQPQAQTQSETQVKPAAAVQETQPQTATEEPSRPRTYTVQSGDTLSKIARQFYGKSSDYKLLIEANKDTVGANGSKLKVGQVLVIPVKGEKQ